MVAGGIEQENVRDIASEKDGEKFVDATKPMYCEHCLQVTLTQQMEIAVATYRREYSMQKFQLRFSEEL